MRPPEFALIQVHRPLRESYAAGFIGLHTLRFYVPSGTSSISLFVKNSWGAVAEVDNMPVNQVTSGGLSGDTLLIILTIIFLLALGFYFLGEPNRKLRSRLYPG